MEAALLSEYSPMGVLYCLFMMALVYCGLSSSLVVDRAEGFWGSSGFLPRARPGFTSGTCREQTTLTANKHTCNEFLSTIVNESSLVGNHNDYSQ